MRVPVGKSHRVTKTGLWPLRLLWLTLPVTAGPALAQSLDPRLDSFRVVATVGLWAGWAVTLTATLVTRDVTLTVVRVTVPAAVVAAGWAAASGASAGTGLLALLATLAAAALVFLPATSEVFVDGSSYGPERRMALRTPTALLLGPIELTWLVVVVGTAAGPLLLAAHQWVAGAVATVVGWPAAVVAVRALHGLSRRWVVFVPAGLVVHDPLTVDAVLFPRRTIRHLGPAPVDHHAVDLSQGALGLALLLELVEPVAVPVPTGRRPADNAPTVEADRFLFTPTRPAALLQEASDRRITVG